jgi:hypothetical protein
VTIDVKMTQARDKDAQMARGMLIANQATHITKTNAIPAEVIYTVLS